MSGNAGPAQVRAATADDTPALSALLASAFHDNMMIAWMIPGDAARRRILPRLYEFLLRREYLPYGVVDVVEIDGVVVGSALWGRPGMVSVPVRRQLRQLPELLGILGVKAVTLSGRFASVASLEQRRPPQPHWYFANLAVAPDAQRHGVSQALVRSGLRRADVDHLPTYGELTAPYFAGRLQAAGFELLDMFTVRDAPPVRPVWRAARKG